MANQYSNEDIAKAIASGFAHGSVDSIQPNGTVIVRIGKSFTRVTPQDLHKLVGRSRQTPKEDLTTIAKKMVAKERQDKNAAKEAKRLSDQAQDINKRHDAENALADRMGKV